MINFWLIGAVLRQRKILFLMAFTATLAVAASIIWSQPPQYVAEALLVPDTGPLRLILGAVSRQDGAASEERTDQVLVANDINVLQSRTLAEMAIDEAQLDVGSAVSNSNEVPVQRSAVLSGLLRRLGITTGVASRDTSLAREEIVRRFMRALKIEVPKGSSQVRISVADSNPVRAASMVNALAAAFLREQAESRQRAIERSLSGLHDTVESLRQELASANAAAQSFRESRHLVSTPGISPLGQQLNELMLAEQRSRVEAQDAAARLEQWRTTGRLSAGMVAAVSEPDRQLLAQSATQDADLRARLARDTATLGASHPGVAELRAQLKPLADRIAAEASTVSTVLASDATANEVRHQHILSSLQSVREELGRENTSEAQFALLNGELRAKQAAYDEALASYDRALAVEGGAIPDMHLLSPAKPPSRPALSKSLFLVMSVPIAALMATLFTIFIHRVTARRRQTVREFEGWSDIPVIGICPTIDSPVHINDVQAYLNGDPLSDYADAVRGVRNVIDVEGSKVVSVAVTSARAGEGKSTLAVSLATAWAAAGKRTLLIDCDMRQTALSRMMQHAESSGLADFLATNPSRDSLLQKLIQTGTNTRYDFMAAGPLLRDATYRFTYGTTRRLIDRFSSQYERIILDLPPILAVSDGAVGSAASDVVLLVHAWARTEPDDTRAALEILRKLGATRIRAVLCRVDRRRYARLDSVSRYATTYVQDSRYGSEPEALQQIGSDIGK